MKQTGINFTGLLAIVFITLKLTNTIDWSWWWVTCPLWGGLVIILGLFTIFSILSLIKGITNKYKK